MNVSTESLPPPPAFLLDRSVQSSPSYLSSNHESNMQRYPTNGTNGMNGMSNGNHAAHPNNFQLLQSIQNAQNTQNSINAQHAQHLQNVAGAVKQLHELRHLPASPNVQRRSLAQNHHPASSNNHPHPPQSHVIIIFPFVFLGVFFPEIIFLHHSNFDFGFIGVFIEVHWNLLSLIEFAISEIIWDICKDLLAMFLISLKFTEIE